MKKEKPLKLGVEDECVVNNQEGKRIVFLLKAVKKHGNLRVSVTGTDPFYGVKGGGRHHVVKKTWEEARRYCLEYQAKETSKSTGVTVRQTTLTASQLNDAQAAFDKLPSKFTLVEVVNDFVKSLPKQNLTIQEAYDKWNEDAVRLRRRPDTFRDRKNTFASFLRKYGSWSLGSVGTNKIKDRFVYDRGAPSTVNGHIRNFKAFYQFCVDEEFNAKSPVAKFKLVPVDKKSPATLTVEEATKLIEVAQAFEGGVCLAYYALLLFVGLRPSEIHDGLLWSPNKKDADPLSWDDFYKLENDNPIINAKKTKNRNARWATIPENCVSLLLSVRDLPLFPTKGFKLKWSKIHKKAGVEWVEDICRHSCVSYMFAKDENMTRAELARRMGHSQAVASEYYWRGITHEEGVAYFNIGLPEGAGA